MNKNILNIINKIRKSDSFKYISQVLDSKTEVKVKDIYGSLFSLFILSLFENKRKIVFISETRQKLDDLHHDLKVSGISAYFNIIKEPQTTLRSKVESTSTAVDMLIEGLLSFSKADNAILVCEKSVMDLTVPVNEKIVGHYKKLVRNDNVNYDSFVKELLLNGFERSEYITSQGQIAVRGGIVDIFPLGISNPLRIEFWGDDIESLREFDVLSQRSIRELDSIEFIDSMFTHSDDTDDEQSPYDYINSETLLIIDETIDILEIRDNLVDAEVKILQINSVGQADAKFKSRNQDSFSGSVKQFIRELDSLITQNYRIVLACEGKIHLDRFRNLILSSFEGSVSDGDEQIVINKEITEKLIVWESNSLSTGFISEELKFAYFTEHQIFERNRNYDSKSSKKPKGMTIQELQELKVGDYIVHEDKGIGIFDGFQSIKIGDSLQDCTRVKFADGDMLYVHLNYIGKLSKYSAQEGSLPVLSKLGSTDWLRRKARTKKRLKDIARDLIKLYAERKSQSGFAFPADTVWQQEFEASFIYEDTPDQALATEEVKRDMENISPMDRLICGDVGFGKTEVAIRAAFKSAQAGKQVAVLVPTTILAQQHYMSFKDRLSKYPVNVDVLSRFRKKKDQTNITENLKSGKIDILIGTHRLLSKDIEFKNLGLLVIDEEHRFGVSHKERLRQLKANIDTLTLTATPIPRTLNFSLMGARDLSLIETAPRNRIPVITEILEWDKEAIIDAVNNEIERGGQVFFVSDKIDDIQKIANEIKSYMPHLNIAVGHGQMKPSELEEIMEKFIEGKYDVLVATKIIESGIDIPNANTMIINRAHNFGLAELYQLRGRVGRSNVQAYCYLITPPAHKLQQKSIRRLQAIEEFTELGSGFKLSMRDLEIRGAGNLLGAEQSGFIIDIGFELYQKVLNEAVQELKQGEFADIFSEAEDDTPKYLNEEIAIEYDEDALFPPDYIKNDTDRFMYYKKLYTIKSLPELEELVGEIKDKFGKLPPQARNLIFVVKLRIASLTTGFSRIIIKHDKLICEFPPADFKDYYEKVFPELIDYLNQIDEVSLRQEKDKAFLTIPLKNRNETLEYVWKIRRITEMAD
ncbi:MAG: transcription-repair coupling factor [Candidatus Kapaibacterium sp.]